MGVKICGGRLRKARTSALQFIVATIFCANCVMNKETVYVSVEQTQFEEKRIDDR